MLTMTLTAEFYSSCCLQGMYYFELLIFLLHCQGCRWPGKFKVRKKSGKFRVREKVSNSEISHLNFELSKKVMAVDHCQGNLDVTNEYFLGHFVRRGLVVIKYDFNG